MKNFNRVLNGNMCLKTLLYTFILSFVFTSVSYASLSGTYTIDASISASSTNYQTFSSAVSDLMSGSRSDGGTANGPGVSGAVVFEVAAGTYSEQLTLGAVSGVSSSNTITFDGGNGNRTSRILTFSSSNNNDRQTVRILNGSFYKFRNLTIRGTGTYAWVFHIIGNSNNIHINNCRILVDSSSTSNNFFGIIAVNDNTNINSSNTSQHSILIDSNYISGGYGAVYFYGNSNVGNLETSYNTIVNYYYHGIAYYSARGAIANYNYIDPGSRNKHGTNEGIRYFNAHAATGNPNHIVGNHIRNTVRYGLYFATSNSGANTQGNIANNLIYGLTSTAAQGIYMTLPQRYNIYHNTIILDVATTSAGASTVNLWRTNSFDVRSNLFVYNAPSGQGFAFYHNENPTNLTLDNNNYVNGRIDGMLIYYDAPLNRDNYQGHLGFNSNSTHIDPLFRNPSASDYRPRQGCMKGAYISTFPNDFDDIPRQNPPIMGAYEAVDIYTNDMAMEEIIEPGFPLTQGFNDVVVLIKNNGSNTITSVDVTVIVGTTSRTINYTGSLGSCESDTVKFTGTQQFEFVSSMPNTLTAYTSNPNGTNDNYTANDTISMSICTPFRGVFTINPSGSGSNNYTSFTEAIDALMCGGIDSHVVFNVSPSTYNESVLIPYINGMGPQSTITFEGTDKSNRILRNSNAPINLLSASYVTFNNFTIESTTNANPVVNIMMSENITFNQNLVTKSTVTNNTGRIFDIQGSNDLLFTDNEVIGGYAGFWIICSDNDRCENIRIINNEIKNSYYYGIYTTYAQNMTIDRNLIQLSTSPTTTASQVLYSSYCYGSTITKNHLIGTGRYGLSLYYENRFENSSTHVSNNMIGGNYAYNSTSTSVTINVSGLNIYYSDNMDIFHNSAYIEGNSYNVYSMFVYYGINHNIQNNIIYQHGTGANHFAYYSFNNNNTTLDYNVYYSNSNSLANDGTGNYSNLQEWKAGNPDENQNSMEEDPLFANKTNPLNIPASKSHFLGNTQLGVNDDFYDRFRCFYIIGAHEVQFPVDPPIANFNHEDTAYVNSPVLILSNTPAFPPQFNSWFINNVYQNDNENLEYIFPDTGIYQIMMVSLSCDDNTDTLIQNIVIIEPDDVPIADFIADKYIMYRGQTVSLRDMSGRGPTSWEWEITPQTITLYGVPFNTHTYVEGTNNTSRNPKIRLNWPGTYTVRLTATNSFGSSSITKEYYINVGHQLCPPEAPDHFVSSTDLHGVLFDPSTGPETAYTGNMKCDFLIELCADTINMEFDKFNLNCNSDFLRIYDGKDTTGIPLHCISNGGFTGGDASCNNACVPGLVQAFSGSVYIVFESGNSLAEPENGFTMRWFANEPTNPSNASFDAQESVCLNAQVNFTNTSIGAITNFYWDFESNGTIDAQTKDAFHSFSSTGSFTTRLIAENCNGYRDTFEKVITVVNPTTPTANISVNKAKPLANSDTVTLSADITGCYDNLEWFLYPSTGFTFINGTNSNSVNPQLVFQEDGCYDVEFIVGNPTGNDYKYEICYIEVGQYCIPSVVNNDPDIGISRVRLEQIDNSSAAGQTSYTNYSATHIAQLEIGRTYQITLSRNTNDNPMNRKVWIDYDGNSVFDHPAELVASQSSSTQLHWTASFTVPVTANIGKTRMRIGTSYAHQSNTPCGTNITGEFEDYGIEIFPDMTSPVITLYGDNPFYLHVFTPYDEPGYLAYDSVDGNLTSEVIISSNLDNTILGDYIIMYEVTDNSGNFTFASRTVIVYDSIWPEIYLLGDDTVYIEVHNEFFDPGVDIIDNYSTNIQPQIVTDLDIHNTGTYYFTYCATDESGNGPVCVNRVVIVQNTTPPVVELIGNDTIIVDVYSVFNDPGISATDNYWHEDSLDISISGTFENTETIGTFTRIYTVTDGDGNTTVVTRIIIVVDRIPPVITLIGDDKMYVKQFSEFIDPGVQLDDNYDPAPVLYTGGTFESTQKAGVFERTYFAVDMFDNWSDTVSRIIVVESVYGIGDALSNNNFKMNVYPNPNKGEFVIHIELSETLAGEIFITDPLGRLVYTVENDKIESGEYHLNLNEMASGIYFINVRSTHVNETFRMMIHK